MGVSLVAGGLFGVFFGGFCWSLVAAWVRRQLYIIKS